MKLQAKIRLLLIVLCLAGVPAAAGRVEAGRAAADAPVFHDDFEDGDYTQASTAGELTWHLVAGGADIDSVDGSLQLGVERGGSLIATNQAINLDAYSLRFEARVTWSAPGRVLVLYQDAQNYYAVGLGSDPGITRRLNGSETTLNLDPQDLIRLPHGGAVTGTFKIYVQRALDAITIKVDQAGDGVDYDLEVTDRDPAALAAFSQGGIAVQDTGSDPGTPWFFVDNLEVEAGLALNAYTPVTYYVDQAHPQASDANPGTASAPWATIQKAADTVWAGDTVLVAPGVYPERITFGNRTRGAPGQLITFKAQLAHTVTMWGFYTKYAHYLRMEGFDIVTDPSLTGWTEQDGVFIDSDYVEIVDNTFTGISGTAISGDSTGAYVAGNHIYQVQMGIVVSGTGWLVEDNEVERLYDYGGGDCDYSRFFGDDHVIRGNFFHGTNFDEIGAAHVDCFQTFDNNGEHAHNVLFDGNTCYDFHQGFMGEAAYYGNTSDLTFSNNIFAHGGAWGLSVHQITNVTVVHNIFADIYYHGAGFRDGASGVVRDNIFYDAGSNYWAADGGTVSGSYNLIYNTTGTIDPQDFPDDLVNVDPRLEDPATDHYRPLEGSPAIDAGIYAGVSHDLEGTARPQGGGYDIGAYEFTPALTLHGMPGNRTARLTWSTNTTLPDNLTWEIVYSGPPGDEPSPVTGLPGETRAYTLTGLSNYVWYTFELNAMLGDAVLLTETVTLMPTDYWIYLPVGRGGN